MMEMKTGNDTEKENKIKQEEKKTLHNIRL